jgi:hypothetical protein
MANEVKMPSVPIDYFGPSYQQLIHADNLIQKGNSRPASSNSPFYPSLDIGSQANYGRENAL